MDCKKVDKILWCSKKKFSDSDEECLFFSEFSIHTAFPEIINENIYNFFEKKRDFYIFIDFSLFKYKISENSFFRWLNKTELKIIIMIEENDSDLFFKKDIHLSKFLICPEKDFIWKDLLKNPYENHKKLLEKKNSSILSRFFPKELSDFTGQSSEIYFMKKKIFEISPTELNVLLLGENGTGKTHLAKIIHNLSGRRLGTFFSVNMAEIPENLVESYLFGSVEGAYTGSKNSKGYFEAANEGTLFLDEISEMPLYLQSKLLTVIETGKFRPVGSVKEKNCNVRIICATNKNLQNLIQEKKFREDLYYRIADFEIELIPLRNRMEDLDAFIKDFQKHSGKKIDYLALNKMKQYNWPGNIRQLNKCLKRADILCKFDEISEDEIIF